jgi:phospholipid/cholesterol/gamma-HCH transport system substrate-binding protein
VSREPVPWGILGKLGAFTIGAVLVTVIVIASLLDISSSPQHNYQALFTDASGLQPGSFVDIAGVQVGTVSGVRLEGLRALVTFSVDTDQTITTTTHAHIDYANLLGQQLLALVPGSGRGRALAPGSTIPPSRTSPAIDLTSIFNGFQPLFNALTPSQINQLTASIIDVFQGESGTVANLVVETNAVTSNLAQRSELIGEVIDNLSTVASTLDTHNQQLVDTLNQFDTLVSNVAGERNLVGTSVDALSQLADSLSGVLTQTQTTLGQAIDGLTSTTHTVAQDQQLLNGVLVDLPAFIGTLDKVSDSGSYLSVYFCNLTIDVSGQANLNVITGFPDLPITFPSGPVGDQSIHTKNCS